MPDSPLSSLHALAVESMRTHGLRPEFPAEALLQAEAAQADLRPEARELHDLRPLPWFSIDNEDTRDLDQLSAAQPLDGGGVRLLVAVADVEAFVKPGGALDDHAGANTTSVYTAAGVFPMLPERLSTDRSSLHEGEERLAMVVDLRVAPEGEVLDAQLYRALVRNQAKLSYDAVSRWLEGDAASLPQLARMPPLEEQLRLHDAVATRLKEARQRRGAIAVDTIAPRPVIEDGRLVDLRPDLRSRAKDLIAELMIAANAATARFLSERGFPSIRRFLQSPRRWDRIEALAASHGMALPTEPDAIALERFLQARRAADPAGYADLSLRIVKMLGPGSYVAAPPRAHDVAHFGLAVGDYTHSTAPNRRYPDLVTQRLVKAALAGAPAPYALADLEAIARHCTLQEGNAAKVERQVLKAAAALLLQDRIGERFDAIVTGASAKGTYVRIASPLVEGRLVRGQEGADVGDALRVKLVAVDGSQGFIDFEAA